MPVTVRKNPQALKSWRTSAMVISTTDLNKNQSKNKTKKLGYLYRHIRLDTNMPFYIGISTVNDGKHERAYTKGSRSKEWYDITDNTEYRVDILLENTVLTPCTSRYNLL